jgi:8-oxo-dGTP pyrophosphatase MutT (NUDIX family)
MGSFRISIPTSIAPSIIRKVLTADDVVRLLDRFVPGGDGEGRKSLDLTLALLTFTSDPFSRNTFTPGHITCTGAVLSPNGDQVLLVHHHRLDRWLLPGGHCEPGDPSIGSVARREVEEETGALLENGEPSLVGVDVHPIPPNLKEPLHLHHDLIFAFRAKSLDTRCSSESRAVTWCSVSESAVYNLPDSIRRAVERARR